MNENKQDLNRELRARMDFLNRLLRRGRPGWGRPGWGADPDMTPTMRAGRSQAQALKLIAAREGVSQRELMIELNVRAGSLSELLSKLEARGLIVRRDDERDKRLTRLYLTQEGRAQASSEPDDPDAALFQALTEAEKESYLALTNKMIDALLAEMDDLPPENGCPRGHGPHIHGDSHDPHDPHDPHGPHGPHGPRGPHGPHDPHGPHIHGDPHGEPHDHGHFETLPARSDDGTGERKPNEPHKL